MDIEITNNGHRKGFIQGHALLPGDKMKIKDVDKDGMKQLEKVQWLAVEKVVKKTKKEEDKTTDEVKE